MKVLEERGKVHGDFGTHAAIAQSLKVVMHSAPAWGSLDVDIKEALDMIQHKIARVLNGNSEYIDNYRDIAGYATLIQKRLQDTPGAIDSYTEYKDV